MELVVDIASLRVMQEAAVFEHSDQVATISMQLSTERGDPRETGRPGDIPPDEKAEE